MENDCLQHLQNNQYLFVCLFVCLLGIASPQVGLPGPSDFVDRSLTPGKDQCIS